MSKVISPDRNIILLFSFFIHKNPLEFKHNNYNIPYYIIRCDSYDIKLLYDCFWPRFLYSSRLYNCKFFRKLSELLGCYFSCFGFISRPFESAIFQSFVKKHKAVTLPAQCFHHSRIFSTEQEY